MQHLAQEKQVLAKEYATNIADFREKLQTVQQHAVATADKLARLQQQHDLIQIDYTKAQQDGDYLRDKLAQQERKIVKLQADCEEKQRVLVQETRAFQEQKQEWTELNNKQHLAIERKEQELINLRSDLQTSKVKHSFFMPHYLVFYLYNAFELAQVQLREKSERLADLSNTHQIVELSLARTTREKQEAEKLLRKSLQNLRFSQPAAVLNSSRGAEESDLTRSFQKEEAEVVNASRRSQSRTLEDAMHQRIARSLSTFNPASSGEPTKRFQSPSPALGKKLGVRDLL
ncbi:hypothetical protein EON65_09115 [archaeon]|nr:MAG: hypothetical protein EON65_09115 [archaeon]